jgi:hypothetical protein
MQVFHIITANYLPYSEKFGNRMSIRSDRFGNRVIIKCDPMYASNPALKWCKKNGFKIVGTGYISDRVILVSSTFKPLIDESKK